MRWTGPARGPVFLEAYTYRFCDHGRGDPIQYRPDGEVESWRELDPLTVARQRLTAEFGVSAETLDAVDEVVGDEVARMRDAALASPFPQPEIAAQYK